ncbi:MAG: phosphoenolpyruvate--protein phosphotransferase [Lentisphaerae bacterium]|nr:phosphoenolpyruvate--protein phosphotransferase [Lentisphaerota bacterium]
MGGTTPDHLRLLAEVGEDLAHLAGSPNVHGFLEETVRKLADHLDTAVCSIYLYDETTAELVLEATVGLSPESVGRIRLGLNEGLVGKAMAELRHIAVVEASKHPDYRYFPEAGEEPFDCFLAAPILRGLERIGVLVVQRAAPHRFTDEEVGVVRALASQLAGAVGHAKVMLELQQTRAAPEPPSALPPVIEGNGVSSGCAVGHACVLRRGVSLAQVAAAAGGNDPAAVLRAFDGAAEELADMQAHLSQRLPEAAALVFEAHVMMLQDHDFRDRVLGLMREGRSDAAAVAETALQYMRVFEASEHDYMKEKARDIEDLALRIIERLQAGKRPAEDAVTERVVVARELLPSDMLRLALGRVSGIVLTGGGASSHVSILARSLQIPTVIADAPELLHLRDNTLVALDGDSGRVYAAPSEAVTARFAERLRAELAVEEAADTMLPETRTRDGVRVRLMANINLLGELDLAVRLKAEGVGLYRTEFPFLVRDAFPTREEQEQIYRRLFGAMEGKEITVRTLDAGGDKLLAYFDSAGEANPELGLRSTRFTLAHPEIFDDQLAALLRAWDGTSPLRIMFPMIASPDEFCAARDRLLACMERERVDAGGLLSVGMMLELPAVAEMMDAFCELADFFSIGTNDFVQYMLAADRANARVAAYYCPHHPAVLRALHRVVSAAVAAGRDIAVCGEMAHDPRYVRFFTGIGVRKLSVDPHWLPAVQRTIAAQSAAETAAYAQALLDARSVKAVEALL